jgi:hypothetical protein
MKVLVGIKRVVDYAVKVRVSKGTVELANVKQSMNPFCEVSVSWCHVFFRLFRSPFSHYSMQFHISHLYILLPHRLLWKKLSV